jgi:hypothetical protein
MSTTKNPILDYSVYIPQQTDIENNIKTSISLEIHDLETKINLCADRLSKNDEEIKKIYMDIYTAVNVKICDCCCNIGFIVLFIIIYMKVYS